MPVANDLQRFWENSMNRQQNSTVETFIVPKRCFPGLATKASGFTHMHRIIKSALFLPMLTFSLSANALPPIAVPDNLGNADAGTVFNPAASVTDNDNDGGSPLPPISNGFPNVEVIEVQGNPAVGSPIATNQGAQVIVKADGSVSYDSTGGVFDALGAGQTLLDSFNYRIRDVPTEGTAAANANITVDGVNDPPVFSGGDLSASIDEGDRYTIKAADIGYSDVDANDGDADITYTVSLPGNLDIEVSSVSQSSFTAAQLDAGIVELVHSGDNVSATSFSVEVEDGDEDSSAAASTTFNVSVNPVNDEPVANDDSGAGFGTDEDTAFTTGSVLTNDTDADTGETATLSVDSVDATSAGGASITDNGNGTFDYDPTGAFDNLVAGGGSTTDTFSYTVVDAQGATNTATVTVQVDPVNDVPVANDDSGAGFGTDEDTAFTTGSVLTNDTDADTGETATLSVDSVDATSAGGASITDNGNGTFDYDPTGAFDNLVAGGGSTTDTFSYTVVDAQGATNTATVTVQVDPVNDVPVANDDSGAGFGTDEDTAFTTGSVLTNDTDADTGETATLSVDSVDATSAGGASITDNGNGTFDYDPTGAFDNLVAGGGSTTDTFSYTVVDAQGATNTATVTVQVDPVNDVPVANDDSGAGFGTDEDTAFTTGSVLTNDTDADTGETATLSVDSVDATSAGGASITDNGNGTFDYDPTGAFDNLVAGGGSTTDTFSYTVVDAQGATNTATVTVQVDPVNDVPVANDDSGAGFGTDEDTAFTTGSVLTNDTDADTGETATLSVDSVDATSAGGASITDNGNGTFDYDPTGAFDNLVAGGGSTTDTFSYTVVDAQGATNTATVTVQVDPVNDVPVANDDSGAGFGTDEDTAFTTGSVLTNDTDADTGETATLSVDSVDATSAGGASITDNGNGTFDYDPTGAFDNLVAGGGSTTDTFSYTVVDAQGATNTATVTVQVDPVNDVPVANDDSGAGFGTDEDTAFTTGSVLTNDTDADTGETATLSVDSVDATSAGGASITDNGNGTFDYDPTGAFDNLVAGGGSTTDTFSYTVVDAQGATNTATVTVQVDPVNDVPVANDDSGAGFGTDEDTAFTTGSVLTNDTDADTGETATLSVDSVDATSAGGASITDNGNGTFDYDPTGAFDNLVAGGGSTTDTFSYTVVDAQGATNTATVTVQVDPVNDVPVANDDSGAGFGTDEDTAFTTGSVLTNDTDADTGETATLSVDSVDATSAGGASITDNGNGTFDYDPTGAFDNLVAGGGSTTDTFSYTVVDAQGATNTATVTVQVDPVNDVPVANDDSGAGFGTDEDTAFTTGSVLTNDTDADTGETATLSVDSVDATSAGGASITDNGNGTFDYDPTGAFDNLVAGGGSTTDTFSYTVVDAQGATNTATVTVQVDPVNDVPVANDDSGAGFGTDEDTAFTTGSVLTNDTDADTGETATLSVDSVDATSAGGASITDNGNGTFDYDPTGAFDNLVAGGGSTTDTFSYTVVDAQGATNTATVTVQVDPVNDVPVANDDSGAGFGTDEDTAFTTGSVLTNDTDADTGETATLSVDSVDATSAGGASITDNGNGTFDYDPTGAFDNLVAGGGSTTDTFSYTVVDAQGATNTATVTVQVDPVNDVPVANDDSGAGFGTDEDTAFTTGSVLTNDTDADTGETATLSVDSVDATSAGGASITDNGNGTFDYDPTGAFDNLVAGGGSTTDTFSYTVVDAQGATNTATVTVQVDPVNDVPVANDDSGAGFGTDEDTAFTTGSVLTNDTDADTGETATLSVDSVDATSAGGASITDNGNGTFDYDPTGAFDNLVAGGGSTTDTFSYTVVDAQGATNTATVTVQVDPVNDVPVANDDSGAGFGTDEDTAFTTGSVLTNDTDADTGETATLSVDSVDATSAGGASITDNGNGTFDYDPTGAFDNLVAGGGSTTDTFSYTVVDAQGATNTATVTVQVDPVNDVPVANDDSGAGFGTDEDTAFTTGSVLTNDTDADTGETATLSVDSVDATSAGGASITDNGNGTFDYDPTGAFDNLVAGGGSTTDTFSYTVVDAQGATNTATVTVQVDPVNDVPVANDDSGAGFGTDEDTAFTTGSVLTNDTDADTGETATLSVDSVDATSAGGASITDNGNGTFDYDPTGAFDNLVAGGGSTTDTFSYTVVDAQGATNTATVTVQVDPVNDVPVANDDSGAGFGTDEDTAFTTGSVLTNDTDADTGETATLSVDSVDATSAGGASITDNGNGTFDYDPTGAFDNLVAGGGSTTDTFSYTVVDAQGATNTATVTVQVDPVNDVPVANDDSGAGFGTDEDTAFTTGSVLTNDTDADTGETATLSVDSVDATSAGGASITDNGNGTFDYDPTGAFDNLVAGGGSTTDTFSYTVVDAQGATNTATVTVQVDPVNDVPVANDDSGAGFGTDEDTAFTTGSVLTNDTDADTGETATLSVDSVDATSAGGASITDNGNGTFDYDPTGAFDNLVAGGGSTTDTFSYTVVDAQGATNTATVTVQVDPVNDVPVANDDSGAGFGTDEDTAFTTGSVLTNDTDADTGETATLSVDSVDATSAGGASITDNGNGTFDYDPTGAFDNLVAGGGSTTDTFSYTVVDAQGATNTATVTVQVDPVNDVPVANDDSGAGFGTDEDTAFTTGSVLTNDTDADTGETATLSVDSVDATSAGGASITDNGNGTFDYDPTGAFDNLVAGGGSTTDTFSYTVVDAQGATNTATVTVQVDPVNDVPVANDDSGAGFGTDEDTAFTTGSVLTNDTDADTGETATLSVDSVDATSAGGASITDNGNGTFDYDPTGAFDNLANSGAGTTDTFSYTLVDAQGATNTATVTVQVDPVNDDPEITSNGGATVDVNFDENTTGTITSVSADDVDGDDGSSGVALTYDIDLSGGADGGVFQIDPASGALSFTSARDFEAVSDDNGDNTYEVTVRANDDSGGSDIQLVRVALQNVNEAPTASNMTNTVAYTEDQGSVDLVNIVVSDIDNGLTGQDITVELSLSPAIAGALTTPGSATFDSGSGLWTITDTLAAVNSALATVAFVTGADHDTDSTITTRVVDQDGEGPADGTITLDVTPVNDAPEATNTTDTVAYTEDQMMVDFADIVVSDVDHADYPQTITATLTLADTDAGVLTASGAASYTPGSGVWTITDDLDAVNSALSSVQFSPAADYDEDTSISVSISDAGAGPSGTITLDVTPVNDTPIATNTTQTINYNEDQNGVDALQPNIVISDVDDEDHPQTITVTITMQDYLPVTLNTPGSSSWNSLTGEWTMTDTVANVNAAFASLTFDAETDWDEDSSFQIQILDQGLAGPAPGTVTLDVVPLNDDPVVNDQAFNIDENSANGTVVGTVIAENEESNGCTPGVDPGCQNIFFEVTGGAFDIDDDGVLTVANSSELDREATDQIIVTVTVTDDGAPVENDTATITVDLNPVNDNPPVGINDAVDVNEGATLNFNVLTAGQDLDADLPAELLEVSAVAGDPDKVGVAQVLSANGKDVGTLTIEQSGAATFVATADNTVEEFEVQQTYTVSDGVFEDNAVLVTITVNPQNDNEPELTPAGDTLVADGISYDEDQYFLNNELTVVLNGLFQDLDIDSDGQLDSNTGEDNDSLVFTIEGNTNPALVNASISNADLMLYSPAHEHGTADLVIRATDTADPSGNISSVDLAFTVTVVSVNDPPIYVTNYYDDMTVLEDSGDIVIQLDAAFSDADVDLDSDPNDDPFGYQITIVDAPAVSAVDSVFVDIEIFEEVSEDLGVPEVGSRTVVYITDQPEMTIELPQDAHGYLDIAIRRQDSGRPPADPAPAVPLFADASFRITVQGIGDDTPVAADDHHSTNPALVMDEDGEPIIINVLANDYLGDAPATVITAGDTIADSLGDNKRWRTTSRLTDRNNTATYVIEMNGEVSCAASGCQDTESPETTIDGSGILDSSIIYKPGPDFNGEDSIVYCIQDAFPGSEPAFTPDRNAPTTDQRCAEVTVMVNPVNDLPRVPSDIIYPMEQAQVLIVPVEDGLRTKVSGVDNTHIDGIGCDPNDPGCNPGPGDPQPDELYFFFQSASTPEGELVAPFLRDGSFNYRPAATFSGSDSFLVDVCETNFLDADSCIFGVTVTIAVDAITGAPEGSSESAVEVDFDLANIPLELPVGPEANVLIVNDDSGSMDWDLLTDQTSGVYFFSSGNYIRYLLPATAGNTTYVAPSEEASLGQGLWRLRSPAYNKVYYNPEVQYLPWNGLNTSDVDFPDSNPNQALHNPLVTSGNNIATNLEALQNYTGRADFTEPVQEQEVCVAFAKNGDCEEYDTQRTGGSTSFTTVEVEDFWLPRYYLWDDKDGDEVVDSVPSPISNPDASEGILVEILSGNVYPKYPNRSDCVALPSNCTYDEELQNFANWFTYSRNREFTAKSALGRVVAESENIRIGYAKLNSEDNIKEIASMNASERTGAKAELLDAIYLTESSGGTPLRRSLRDAGRYFECVANDIFDSSTGTDPGQAGCPVFAAPAGNCQQNFTLLISDGEWTSNTGPNIGDADDPTDNDDSIDSNFDGGMFAGSFDNSLADVAMHYYERDLHSLLSNEVPTTARDRDGAALDAFEDQGNDLMHQHMKTYTIGFGVSGLIEDDDVPTDYTQSFNWGTPTDSTARKVDDARHAAVNGRGEYLSAGNASALADALLSAFNEFQKSSGSASAVSFNSQEVQEDTLVFRAFYNTKNNTGDLIAQEFIEDPDTGLVTIGDEAWNAAGRLDSKTYDERVIITYDRDPNSATYAEGIPFRPLSLNDEQRSLFINDGTADVLQQNLEVNQRVNYLRGDPTNERPAGNFRERPGVEGRLGDIVHSAPTFIGPPNRLGQDASYAAFRTANESREAIVYVAANDGMLHGFNAETGDEEIAYVPENLMTGTFSRKISELLNYEYTHEYFVDSSPAINDVFINHDGDSDKEWRTVLVNGQGAGAKAYFALDITDPSKFDEDTAEEVVLWEFTDDDDAYPTVVEAGVRVALTNNDDSQRQDLQTVPRPVKDLGYSFSVPTLVPSNLKDGDGSSRWVAVLGNGYNSTAGIAKLFVLFLDAGIDGTWCHPDKQHNDILDATPLPAGCGPLDYDFVKLDTTFGVFQDNEGNNVPNGLGEPRVIDVDNNGTADYAYAGDMQGNFFRFDLTSDDFADWSVTKIFEAKYKPDTIDESIQAITTQPIAIPHPTEDEGHIIIFGTGAYLRTGDATDNDIQSIYGIWDRLSPELILKTDLQMQSYTAVDDGNQGSVRTLSDTAVDYSIIGQRKGWYIDLDVAPADGSTTDPEFPGEKAVRNIQVRGGLAFTASVFPRPQGSCVGQAGGALLSFCPDTGSSLCFLNKQIFDLNNDGQFDSNDALEDGGTAAGVILENTTPPTDSAFIGSKLVTQQGTDLTVFDTNTSSGNNTGRISWQRMDQSY